MPDDAELSDYLLGELDEAERARFELRLEADPALRARAERLRPLAGQLSRLPAEAWPPPPRAVPRRGRSTVRSRRWATTALAGLALLGVGLAVGVRLERSGQPTGKTLQLSALAGAPPAARGLATITASDRIRLTVQHLRPTRPGHYYEAWLMTDATHLVALASFTVNAGGGAQVELPLPAPPARYRYIDVSFQRAAAGPSHSGVSVLRGPTAKPRRRG